MVNRVPEGSLSQRAFPRLFASYDIMNGSPRPICLEAGTMPEIASGREHDLRPMTRRLWLAGSLLGGMTLLTRGGEPDKSEAEPEDDLSTILARAKQARLTGFRASRTTHYLGVGNAPDKFRNEALAVCEALAREYQRF